MEIGDLIINVESEVNKYKRLCHTTDLNALKFIMSNGMTFKCSSLNSPNLNDQFEQERTGIKEFSSNQFICCFCHSNEEKKYFWENYGGSNKSQKILLKFANFSKRLLDVIFTDYAVLDSGKKLLFVNDFMNIDNRKIDYLYDGSDYVRDTHIDMISMYDIKYKANDDQVFNRNYLNEDGIIHLESETLKGSIYDLRSLGHYKTAEWKNEHETRLMFSLSPTDHFNKNSFHENQFYIRLKEEIFRDLTIVLSPWFSYNLKDSVDKIIFDSPISDKLKDTIKVEYSKYENAPGY